MTTTTEQLPAAGGLERLLGALRNVRKIGDDRWEACCPAHDDDRPSLSVTRASDNVTLLICRAGCETDAVLAAVGMKLADLFPRRNGHASRIAATYDYRDTDGTLLFQVVRFEPKAFRQRRPIEGGGWTWSVKGVKVVPYRLQELLAADRNEFVYSVEGEKDADRLRSFGLIATCNAGGAGKWRAAHAKYLRDRRVVVVPDNDQPGRAHAEKVAKSLDGIAASIKVVTLPGVSEGGDVSDWLDAGGTADALRALVEDTPEWTPATADAEPKRRTPSDLPEVELPGGERTISAAAADFADLLADKSQYFARGGVPVRLTRDDSDAPILHPVKPCEFASDVERVAQPVRTRITKEGPIVSPANCSESAAKLMLHAQSLRDKLPALRVLSRCPVLVERNGSLVVVTGYDAESGVLAYGDPPADVDLDTARGLLGELIADFRFASPADRSRALAAAVTPALVFGGLLPGRSPVDLGEADESQSGKGYRNRNTAAVYRHQVVAINQSTGSIGGLEESFDRALIAGQQFIAFDNIRGRLDSPKVESFLTEDVYYARCAYTPTTEISPHRVYVMFTSNKADVTQDLANRCSCVRILKQPADYQFRTYTEGDLLSHVRAQQPLYLGAVFAIVRAWHAAGKPRTAETRHDFRAWGQTLDWIVQNLLGEPPLMDGHRETQRRMTTPAVNWLRELALAVVKQGKDRQWLSTAKLIDCADAAGIAIPGLSEGSLEDDAARKSCLQHTGRRLSRCFGDETTLTIDGLVVERATVPDPDYRERREYRVILADPAAHPAATPLHTPLKNPRDPAAPAAESLINTYARAHTHAHEASNGNHQRGQRDPAFLQRDATAGCAAGNGKPDDLDTLAATPWDNLADTGQPTADRPPTPFKPLCSPREGGAER